MTGRPRIGLVLGAGGVVGHAFHAGVLSAIEDASGWDARRADLIVGTSAGSVVGTLLRAGISPHDLAASSRGQPLSDEGQRLVARVRPLSDQLTRARGLRLLRPAAPGLLVRMATRPWNIRPGILLAGFLPAGAYSTDDIAARIDDLLSHAVGATPPRLWVTAVRLHDGALVTFGRDVTPANGWGAAVAASCAIPGFFAPVAIDGHRYVDGGAHSPTNADLLGTSELDLMIVVSTMSAVRSARLRRVDAGARMLYRLRLAAEVASVRRRGTPVVVFLPTSSDLGVMGVNAMDPARRRNVTDTAYQSVIRRFERPDLAEALAALGSA